MLVSALGHVTFLVAGLLAFSSPAPLPDNEEAIAVEVIDPSVVKALQDDQFIPVVSPVGFGVLSESQLLERIATVASPAGEARLPGATQRLALP